MNIRISKYLSSAGICSRRDAEKLIGEKKIKINNKICIHPSHKVNNLDVIKFNLIKLNYLNDFISLGGIDSSNIRREKMCKSAGVASISWVKKNGPSINTGPF